MRTPIAYALEYPARIDSGATTTSMHAESIKSFERDGQRWVRFVTATGRGDKLVTPPLSRGLLPGVLRHSLIEMGEAVEDDLKPRDLAKGFFIGNAARGMVAASLVK